ncbi:MAG TPA: TetR/AcrR family transcriptional regulator [Methylobacterium sp.]|jgi:AcrR family transcriptional regulator|uniref:TetR/AcrR family transcriptional regulator n=1 Tax=Methylorubrum sp. B1-46 TaxID=2897334 RepID=UPI001E2B1230|nr:TetR/AcrR family transcriptional regulator [Methylorubrum sp. B1-46]UGB27031.1 TetR/AcrR family transcriptional regulator [Methylorubrum sp. B1-46]HEV2542430.1 TetR/AcrR family transcriptional regulator [Methylobacterium sp.]
MASALTRKKQPEFVRRNLLEGAARLVLEHGPAGLTMQAVSDAAGVTKGGLFHHFPSKQALALGIFAALTERLDAEIDAAMTRDPSPSGSFTRAYVEAVFSDPVLGRESRTATLHLTALADPGVRRLQAEWIARRLERHRATDGAPALEVVRLAADGAWQACLLHAAGGPLPDMAALRVRLLAMAPPDPRQGDVAPHRFEKELHA